MQKLHHIFFLLLTLALAASCHQRQQSTIKQAIALANEFPDSALKVLDGIDRHSLSDGEQAMYALAYTLAQDKSGLDVNNDSLIRLAYDHYKDAPTDSLYGRCMYYMGKYYMLVDSLERAKYCLGLSEKAFCSLKDTANQCMALLRLCWIDEYRNPKIALMCANKASTLYSNYSHSKPLYMMMYTIAVVQSNFFCGDTVKSVEISKKLLKQAEESGDSSFCSEAYHNLSWVYAGTGEHDEALHYAQLALDYSMVKRKNLYLNLAQCYEDCGKNIEAFNLLDTLHVNSKNDKFHSFHSRFQLSCKMGDNNKIMVYADSAFENLAEMYVEAANDKDKYYSEAMNNVKKTSYEKGRASQYQMMAILIVFLSVISLLLIYSAYFNYKSKMRLKLKKEIYSAQKEKEEILKEKNQAKEYYNMEIERQIAANELLRKYIFQKVDIVCKLKSVNGDKSPHVVLDDDDWKEIEEYLNVASDKFVERFRTEFPNFKEKDIQMFMLLRIELPAKTIANIYCISEKSVRQKLFMLKKKVGLDSSSRSLRTFINGY